MINYERLHKYSAPTVGAFQAVGVGLYISLFATLVNNIEKIKPEPPEMLGIMFFLTAFVISALVCSSLVLGYPVLLALEDNVKRAVQVVAWSALSLVIILGLVVVAAVSL